MLMFAITGITLNHAADIDAVPQLTNIEKKVPDDQLALLDSMEEGPVTLPRSLRNWLSDNGIAPPSDKEGEEISQRRKTAWCARVGDET